MATSTSLSGPGSGGSLAREPNSTTRSSPNCRAAASKRWGLKGTMGQVCNTVALFGSPRPITLVSGFVPHPNLDGAGDASERNWLACMS